MSITDLKVPRMRCIYNIKSARWAGEHFTENIRFKTRGTGTSPTSTATIVPTTAASRVRGGLVQDGDKVTCDTCSLAVDCKFYRVGAVCSVPGTESSVLAEYFQSRDSGNIIDGLGAVLAAQTRRLEKGMEDEEEFGDLDPEVSKMLNSVFANGVKLAKLVDPTLTKPQVIVNNNGSAVASGNPKQMVGTVVAALEAKGIARADITEQMVKDEILNMYGMETPKVIEGRSA